MKKMLALVMAMLLALGCCAAFAEGDEITLDVIICQYGPNTQDWFLGKGMNGTNFVDKFQAENPGIKLNLQVVSWNDVYTEVSTRISNNNAPDILNIDTFSDYAVEGLLLPVSDYCPEELFKDFFPSFIEQSVIDDTVWAVPDLASVRAMWVNTDILSEVGIEVPTTWAELEDACQAIVDFYDGEVYPWGIDMTTDEGQAAFAYYIWNNGSDFKGADDAFALFGAGKLAMVIAPNNMPEYLAQKEIGDFNYGYYPIPVNEGAAAVTPSIMDRVMAFKDDSYPDQAKRNEAIGKFLSFFYNPENYVGWVSMEGFMPAVNSSVEALVKEKPEMEAWLSMMNACKFYPLTDPKWIDVKQGVIDVEQQALTGGDVKALLDDLQAKIAG